MPVRLILLLLLVIFEGAFIGFNLENVCNVWLFKVFEAVPVYITVLISFVAGALFALLLLAFGRFKRRARERSSAPRKEKKQRIRKSRKEERTATSAAYSPPAGINAISTENSDKPDSYDGGFKDNG